MDAIETKTPITYDNVLIHVASLAASATSANFNAIASGSLAYLVGYTWASKADRKPSKDIAADLVRQFQEETKAGRTKRYEFASLCLTIARQLKAHAWQAELAQQDSIESAVTFLAARFGSVAKSVAELSREFGTSRAAGGKKSRKGLAETIQTWLDKIEDGEAMPFPEAVKAMVPLASVAQMVVVIRDMLPKLSDSALADLAVMANDTVLARADHAQALADYRREQEAMSKVSREIDQLAA